MNDHEVKMIILSTDDLDESIRFYSETLGMSLKFRDGAHFAALDGGPITLALATAVDHPIPGQVVVGIKTADVDAAAKAVEASGGGIVKGPYDDAHEHRAVVYDNKGNGRGLLQAAGPMNDGGVGTRATEAMGLFIEAVDQIPSTAWDQPSNEPDDWKSDDPAGQLRELAARLHGALVKADLDALREALTFPIVGLTIHTWDVYRSQDRPLELPKDLFGFCRQVAESVPEDELRRPGLFGPAQPVPEDATPTARLMAYFGRPVA